MTSREEFETWAKTNYPKQFMHNQEALWDTWEAARAGMVRKECIKSSWEEARESSYSGNSYDVRWDDSSAKKAMEAAK